MDTDSTAMGYRAKLFNKVNAIANELGAVKADGHNTFSGYDYISYEQVNARLRTLLPKHKLAIAPSFVSCSENQYTDAKGKITIRSIVNCYFHIIDTETGYEEILQGVGADVDTQGKSLGQAITEATKRFELKLFHISTKADIDPDSKSVEVINASDKQNPRDAIAFIQGHEDLVALCKKLQMKRGDIEKIVMDCKFDKEKVKNALSAISGF